MKPTEARVAVEVVVSHPGTTETLLAPRWLRGRRPLECGQIEDRTGTEIVSGTSWPLLKKEARLLYQMPSYVIKFNMPSNAI